MSTQIVDLLIAQRNRINAALFALQAEGEAETPKRRGRPPKAPTVASADKIVEEVRRRRGRTPAQKKLQSEAMAAYHAKRKRAEKREAKKVVAKVGKKAAPVTGKRRGRPPGSKNAPKVNAPKPEPTVEPIEQAA